MSEVDQPEHTINHGVAQGDQCIDRPVLYPVEELRWKCRQIQGKLLLKLEERDLLDRHEASLFDLQDQPGLLSVVIRSYRN